MTAGSVRCAVVIPTYNRSAILGKLLVGLSKQTAMEMVLEVIIVDDGSTDDTADTVRSFKDVLPIRFLQRSKSGVAAARNAAVASASAPVVIFLDDDVIPSPQLIAEHLSFHRDHPDPHAMLLGYVTWHPDMDSTPFMDWYGESGALFGYAHLKDDAPADHRYLYFCNLSAKTEFMQAHGRFNERLTVLEDLELSERMKQSGALPHFRRSALGYHYQHFTFQQACDRLKRYSSGLPVFLETDAGVALLKRHRRGPYRMAAFGVRIVGPLLSPFKGIVDSNIKLPGLIYRTLYLYFASLQSFWDLAGKRTDI